MEAISGWLEESVRWLHVIAGFVGLAAFWVPVVVRKGGKHHRLFGKIFKYCAYIVLIGAGVAVVRELVGAGFRGIGFSDNPEGFAFLFFLGYLALLTWVVLRHGLRVLLHKRDLREMNQPTDRLLARAMAVSSLLLIAYALYYRPDNMILLLALSPLGLLGYRDLMKALNGKVEESRPWFFEHMGAMLGVGVAFHTAFAVFGASRIFELNLTGTSQVIPWIMPAIVGTIGSVLFARHFRRQFQQEDSERAQSQQQASGSL